MNKSVIVLGGSGFLGIELLKQLKKANFSRVACGNRKHCNIDGVEDIPTDILNYENLKKSCEPFDLIINCTGQVSNPTNLCLRLNTEGIQNIARVVKEGKKIIQISTVAVYGTTGFADEDTCPNPETPYAACKSFAEYLLKTNLEQDQFLIVRLSNLFGPGQTKGIFSYFMRSFLSDHQLDFNNDGNLTRYYLHVEDAACNIVQIMEKGLNGTMNLKGEQKYSIKDLIRLAEIDWNVKFKVRFDPTPPLENIGEIPDNENKDFHPQYKHNVNSFLKESLEF